MKLFTERYWRIGVAAVLAGTFAFIASFAVAPKYVSTVRMLLVENSTTSLSSTGQPISDNTAVVDVSGLAQTLSETQAGLVSSREVATMIVNQLHLDTAQPPKGGPIQDVTHALESVYHHMKAWFTYGTYVTLPTREQAIQSVQSSVAAIDLAPAGGPDTGQADSFTLQVSAVGNSAIQAQKIATAAASDLIIVSRQRFTDDSRAYAKALGIQLNDANSTLASDNQAVSNYESAHDITPAEVEAVQDAQAPGSLSAQLISKNSAVQGDQQTVSSLEATLATTAPTETTSQDITTGRSSTGDSITEANPVYQTLEEQLSQAQAALASDSAEAQSLQSQLQSNSSQLTQAEAGLLDLQQKVTADQSSVQSLSSALQQANANIAVAPAELSQMGGATLPAYPASPKRYLYLLIGLFLGGAAGAGLTYQARRRQVQISSNQRTESDSDQRVGHSDQGGGALIPGGIATVEHDPEHVIVGGAGAERDHDSLIGNGSHS